MNRPRAANLLLLAAFLIASWIGWFRLPERIPRHFQFSGEPDAWTERSIFYWFLLPALAVTQALLIHGVTGFIERRVRQEAPLGKRTRLVRLLLQGCEWFGVLTTGLLMLVQWAVWRTALGEESKWIFDILKFAVFLGLPLLTVGWTLRLILLQREE